MTKVLVQTGVEHKYHTIGSPDDPAIVLIAGFGAQLLSWHDRLCRLLVDKGRLVIRFDNRDCGLSTKLDDHPVDLGAIVAAASNGDLAAVRAIVPYTLHDVADDVVGLLDELDIQRAHVVDASMGGMVAQLVAIHHSERTGEAENGQSTPDATAALLGSPPTDRSTYVSVAIAAARVWGSSRYFDPDAAADVAAASFDRCYSPQGTAQQIGALLATGSLADHLRGAGRRPLGHRARLGRRPDPHRGVGHGLCGPRRPEPEVVNSAAGMVIFPLTFVANTFVPADNLSDTPADLRRVEPDLGRDTGSPRAVRQHPAGSARARRVGTPARRPLHAHLGGGDHRDLRPPRHPQVHDDGLDAMTPLTTNNEMEHLMKAIVYRQYGSPDDVLELADIDKPVVNDNDVLVRVHAAAVNPADWHLVRGEPYIARLQLGLRKPKDTVLGCDVAGQAEVVGKNVSAFQPGDEVFASSFAHGHGALAEYVRIPDELLALKPANLSFEQAAAVPLAALTALQGLRDHGRIAPGHKVLIIGASGGVGTFAVQIAKAFGAEVTGVCSTRKVDMVRSIGADQVIDYTQEDFTRSGKRYDLIFQLAGTRSPSDCRRSLTTKGTLVLASGESGGRWIGPVARIIRALLLSPFVSQKMASFTVKPNSKDLQTLKELIESGKVTPVIDRTHPLTEVPEAIRYVEEGHTQGKVVVTL